MGGKHYLPLTDQDRREMLAAIGVGSVEDLFSDIPAAVRLENNLNLPAAMSESEVCNAPHCQDKNLRDLS